MATHRFNNINDLVAREENGNVLISKINDPSLSYVGIECSGGARLYDLHAEFRNLCLQNPDLISVVSPYMYQPISREVIATKCLSEKTLNQLDASWFFDHILIRDLPNSSYLKPLYATLKFKKLIYSLLSHVRIFEPTQFRPVLNLDKMFVSHVGEIIFTQYEPSCGGYKANMSHLSNEVMRVLRQLVGKWANHSETLMCEFWELCDWVNYCLFSYAGREYTKEVLKQAVFWTPAIRIRYITFLDDASKGKAKFIQQDSQDAFLEDGSGPSGSSGSRDWYSTIQNSAHPVLPKLLERGDKFYKRSVNPSYLCAPVKRGDTPSTILVKGLRRIRDSYFHPIENSAQMSVDKDITMKYTNIEYQHMFQDFFPYHMAEFAKSQGLTNFNAIGEVLTLFRESYLEDVQPHIGDP